MNEQAPQYESETIEQAAGAADIFTRAINTPEVRELATATDALTTHYQDFLVQTDAQYADGADELRRIKQQQSVLEERRFAITRPMDAAKKAVMDFFRPFSDRLDDAEIHVKKALTDYSTEKRRIADEAARLERQRAETEARRLREEARVADEKAAAKERDRLAELQRKEDERERLAAERAAAKTEEDEQRAKEQEAAAEKRRQAEQDRLHQERLESEAAQRERTARAETLEVRAETVVTAPVASAPKVKGISTRKNWKLGQDSQRVFAAQHRGDRRRRASAQGQHQHPRDSRLL